jgi:nanoRNase/pAp phosphatase (c-di-AMP/oligoRNAs hydrolase)
VDALLSRLREAEGRILWLMHVSADPDCVGSSFALREAFGGTVGAPDGMNKAGEKLAKHLGIEVDVFPHPENFSLVVVVDTGSRAQLGRLGPRVPAPLMVDHHRYGDLHEGAPAKAWDPARSSCAEVVLSLLDVAGIVPSSVAARGLLAGLITDTARFRHADAHAFAAAARLTALSGAKLEDIYRLFEADDDEEDPTLDLRRASLVAISRAQVTEERGFLLAVSHVGSFDAAAAAALVRAGADLAIVGKEKQDEARLSVRASPRLRGLHLGELTNAVAREIAWSGGGHEGAAGMRGAPPLARAQDALLSEVKRRLEAS